MTTDGITRKKTLSEQWRTCWSAGKARGAAQIDKQLDKVRDRIASMQAMPRISCHRFYGKVRNAVFQQAVVCLLKPGRFTVNSNAQITKLRLHMNYSTQLSLYCNECGQATTHELGERYAFNKDHERDLLHCLECNTPQMRWADRSVEPPFELYFPPHDVRAVPSWIDALPLPMAGLLRETLRAFAEDHLWLVAMGSRTLIDMFALERIGDTGGFNAKLTQLQTGGYLSPRDVLLVKAAVEVGHEATHRNHRPSAQDCHAVLDIVEHLLQRIVLDRRALDHLQNRAITPPSRCG